MRKSGEGRGGEGEEGWAPSALLGAVLGKPPPSAVESSRGGGKGRRDGWKGG